MDPTRRRYLFRASAVVLGVCLALVVAEGLGRLIVPDVYLQRGLRDGGVLVAYEPNVEADLLADEFRVRFRINRLGFRDRLDRGEARAAGRKRILLLGDSFSAGWGVAFEETYGYALEEALGVDVVNAAKSGGCPLFLSQEPPEVLSAKNPHGELLRGVCAARGVPFFDGVALLGDAPDPKALYFAHDGHLNAAGHAHLAKALAKTLPQAVPALR